jgi:hypothetical protein
MIAKGFKSVMWVATVGTAALGCYMVSLQVATERAELARVESQIIAAKQDIRSLQTELGTRGRMSQLEHWNAEVLALSSPTSAQFLPNEVTLARFEQRDTTIGERSAEVRMAAAEVRPDAPAAAPVVHAVAAAPEPVRPLVHQASFTAAPALAKAETRAAAPAKTVLGAKVAATAAASTAKPAPKVETAAAKPKMGPAQAKAAQAKAEPKKPEPGKVEPRKGETATAAATAKVQPEKPRVSKIDAKLAAEIKAPKKAQGSGGN